MHIAIALLHTDTNKEIPASASTRRSDLPMRVVVFPILGHWVRLRLSVNASLPVVVVAVLNNGFSGFFFGLGGACAVGFRWP